jgi:hypothetical protein
VAAPAPKPRPERKRRPRRAYVVVDLAPEDSDAGTAAAEAWLREVAPPPRSV